MFPEFVSDPAWINAFFAGLAALIGVVFLRGRTSSDGASSSAPHQEILRPETDSEKVAAEASIRSAKALEDIADIASRIERHLDFLTTRKRS